MRHLILIFSLPILWVLGQDEITGPLPEALRPPDDIFAPPPQPEVPEPLPPPDIFDQFPIQPIPDPTNLDAPLADILSGDDNKKPNLSMPSGFQIEGSPEKIEMTGRNYLARFNGPITLTSNNGLQAYSDRAIYSSAEEQVQLSGNVSVYKSGFVYRGESATYHYTTKELDMSNLRLAMDPILMEAGRFKKLDQNGRSVFVGENSGITTHDVQNPHFWLRSKKTTVIPGEKVIFNDFTLQVGDRKIFWLPYLSQPLDTNLGYLLTPGGRSNLGVYAKNRYGIMLGGQRDPETGENKNAWLLSQWHADLYSRRGLGLGVDFSDTRLHKKDQFGYLKLYHLYDFDPTLERAGLNRGFIDPNRFRVEFAHRLPLWDSPTANYSFETNLTLLSDEYYLEDFDPSIYRTNNAPLNYLGITRRTANSLFTFSIQPRINHFYQSNTRLPELTHDWNRQPFLNSDVLYESQSSLGFYQEHLAQFQRDSLRSEVAALLPGDPRIGELKRLLEERGFARLHTYHELSLPLKTGHLNITPRIGAGHTRYEAVLGPDNTSNRTHFSAGLDFSTKLSRSYPELSNHKWGLDGARHIIEPYASLSWLATDELDSSFGLIDRLTPTTRPRSRHLGRFTAIDDIQDWGIVRLGMRNRLMTRRNDGTHDWLTVDTYFDTFIEDPEFDREFSNLYNDISWNPTPWLQLDLETQFPLFSDSNFTEVAASLRFMPTDSLEFNIDYRHLNGHPILRDSDRVVLESFARLNEYWGIGTYHRFELVDHALELQRYNIHYDFDSFVGSIGLFHRNNQSDNEYGIMLSFGIKEIPSLSLPIEFDTE